MESNDVIQLKDIAINLTSISWTILEILKRTERVSYSEIRKKVNASQNKVAVEIARLQGALLIKDDRDEVDKRVIYFSLSDNGIKIFEYKNQKRR